MFSKVRDKTGFERGLWPKKIKAIAQQDNLQINRTEKQLFYMVQWDGDREPEYISSADLVQRVPMMVLVALQNLVDYSDLRPNGCTKGKLPRASSKTMTIILIGIDMTTFLLFSETQQRNFIQASMDCQSLALLEAEKAKKMWADTVQLADWKE